MNEIVKKTLTNKLSSVNNSIASADENIKAWSKRLEEEVKTLNELTEGKKAIESFINLINGISN